MKILIVSQYYPPESATIAPAIARGLAEKGHEVRVLTGFPNYPTGVVFDGYKQRWRQREFDGLVEVLRVPLYANHSMNALARILNYTSFALTAASARDFAKDVDVIYVYATQMTPALGPWLWRKFGGAPFVLHVQDLWPDSILGSSMVSSSRFRRVVETVLTPWLRSVYTDASGVIGIAPTMVKTLIERGASKECSGLIFNWGDDSVAERPAENSGRRNRSGTSILYAGNVGEMQDLKTVVRAARLVDDTSVKVRIVGDGVALDEVKRLSDEIGATNVEFQGRVPRNEMARVYEQADFALVTLKDLPVFRGTIPSKFQASIAHGLPIVTNVQGDLKSLVEDLEIGITAEAESPESLARAFAKASEWTSRELEEARQRARDVYLESFSQTAGIDGVESVLFKAMEDASGRSS